jgi:ribosomal protein S18 acetylase RimI-like enzyme
VADKLHQLRYLYRAMGATGVVALAARKLLAPLYQREVRYILLQDLESPDVADPEDADTNAECIVLESPAALDDVQSEIPTSFRFTIEDFRERLERGCVVFLVRSPTTTGSGKEIVGYNISERGVFTAFDRARPVSPEIFYSHYTEILPEYRGRRIQQALVRARIEHCRNNGVRKRCTTVGTENRPGLVSGLRAGKIVGTIERVSILCGLVVRETPWERIEQALRT